MDVILCCSSVSGGTLSETFSSCSHAGDLEFVVGSSSVAPHPNLQTVIDGDAPSVALAWLQDDLRWIANRKHVLTFVSDVNALHDACV